jgi:hypothetical protein
MRPVNPPDQPVNRQSNTSRASVPPDAGIASYFIWMRRQSGLSIHQTAALLQTEAEVIDALEAGAIAQLPAWRETARIVAAYAAMAGVDPNAPLSALRARWPAQPKAIAVRTRQSINARNANRLSLRLW